MHIFEKTLSQNGAVVIDDDTDIEVRRARDGKLVVVSLSNWRNSSCPRLHRNREVRALELVEKAIATLPEQLELPFAA